MLSKRVFDNDFIFDTIKAKKVQLFFRYNDLKYIEFINNINFNMLEPNLYFACNVSKNISFENITRHLKISGILNDDKYKLGERIK